MDSDPISCWVIITQFSQSQESDLQFSALNGWWISRFQPGKTLNYLNASVKHPVLQASWDKELRELSYRSLFLELLPKRPLTWRAYRTTALAHRLISALNLLESRSSNDDTAGSIETSMKEKHRLKLPRFVLLPPPPTSPLSRPTVLFTDMVIYVLLAADKEGCKWFLKPKE